VPDILAIVSRAVFERDARIGGKPVGAGDVWPVDRYNSSNKALQSLEGGGRIFLVTVRPPNEELLFLGIVDSPDFDGTAWVSATPNHLPATNISSLRKAIVFESGKGMSQDTGTLGMSLQTPRALTASDAAQILALATGRVKPSSPGAQLDATKPSPKTAPPQTRPRVIGGKYEILGRLGQGGMGAVYEARHTGTGRRVALKEIIGEGADREQLVERLEREARATAEIESRHITPILDSGTDPETKHPYIVMELLRGEDLQQLMVRQRPLIQDTALRIVAQACAGLQRAHEAGVVHRDIKPANLFLSRREGEEVLVKVLDFGIARFKEGLATAENHALTSTGLMLGTPLYMSPEQVQGPKHVDHRSDLWSIGVVLYEALTGATPHRDVETLGGLLVAICSRPARSLREVAPHIRSSVGAIVKKALELEPAARYQSANELLLDLRKEVGSTSLDEEMIDLRPQTVRADKDARDSIELGATLLAPVAPAEGGTLRSATPIPGARAMPAGERKDS
jgi:serine/threonine protein kinase